MPTKHSKKYLHFLNLKKAGADIQLLKNLTKRQRKRAMQANVDDMSENYTQKQDTKGNVVINKHHNYKKI